MLFVNYFMTYRAVLHKPGQIGNIHGYKKNRIIYHLLYNINITTTQALFLSIIHNITSITLHIYIKHFVKTQHLP